MPILLDACVAQHIGDRKEQQDRAGLLQHPRQKKLVLAVLADGMGGHTGGALAAGQVVLTGKNCLEQFSPGDQTPDQLLTDALNETHSMIRAGRVLNEQDPNSTGVILLLHAGEDSMTATWAHTGDSRLYHFRRDKSIFHTRDHSFVEQMMQKGYMTPEQAAVHPNRNVLVTSLGGEEAPLIDVGTAEGLQGGDSFLLCSDGMWAYFSEPEMQSVISYFSAREAAQKFIDTARQRANGRGDNCTVVIVKLETPPPPKGMAPMKPPPPKAPPPPPPKPKPAGK